VLADAQTNGGLLAAIPAQDAAKAISSLKRVRIDASIVGEVIRGPAGIDVLA
jgi:selenide,water dikinase